MTVAALDIVADSQGWIAGVEVTVDADAWLAERCAPDEAADEAYGDWLGVESNVEDDSGRVLSDWDAAEKYAGERGPDSGAPYGDCAPHYHSTENPGGGGSYLDAEFEMVEYVDAADGIARVIVGKNGLTPDVYRVTTTDEAAFYDPDRATVFCNHCDSAWDMGRGACDDGAPLDLVTCRAVEVESMADPALAVWGFSNAQQRAYYKEHAHTFGGVLIIQDDDIYRCPVCLTGKLEACAD